VLPRLSFLIAALAALSVLASSAPAATHFTSCGDRPSQLRFNIQAHHVGCPVARGVGKLVDQKVTTIRSHTFEYQAKGYTCRYTVFSSTKAGDGEGEIFDCRKPGKEVRWSNAEGIAPRSIKP
jgi:hypothetical protein